MLKFNDFLKIKTEFTNNQTVSIKNKCLPNEAMSGDMR